MGRTAAGQAPGRLDPDSAHRILTGAALPVGAEAVVAQENVHRHGDFLQIAIPLSDGTNVRRRGEDIRAGQTLIAEGTVLDWRHVAVLAAQGAHAVSVRRRPEVVLLSSGRELRGPGEQLHPGQIHDSNLPMLMALFQAWGAAVRPAPIVHDDPAAMRDALRSAAEGADLVVTSAGISVGDEDHVRDALSDLGGSLSVLKVAMKPGKPLAAGRIGGTVFIGLPGNPLAALAGAVAFVRPVLARMTGATVSAALLGYAGFDMRREPGRAEFIPVRLCQRDACLWAERTGPDGSGRLAPLLDAGGFVFLPTGIGAVRRGDGVDVIPFPHASIASERVAA
jgi:molybdopterin molybdotransferase